MESRGIVQSLERLLGPGKVATTPMELLHYSSDMYPKNQILKLGDKQPETRPVAVVFPDSVEEVAAAVKLCREERIPVVPYGAGSGVCGSAVPEHSGVMLDLKRLAAVQPVSADDRIVVAEAGLLGERLEDYLNARGMTLGHFPSSINCSTVGGWIACRSAGQFSSRYGKIEDLTLGLEVVTPDGEIARFGHLAGTHPRDPMLSLMLGSEGTLGIITKAALKIERLPAVMDFRGFAFFSMDDALLAMRRIMQSAVRPTVLRLYDPLDSLLAGFHRKTAQGQDVDQAVALLGGIKHLAGTLVTELNEVAIRTMLLQPQWMNRLCEVLPARPLLIVGVQGDKAEVAHQWEEVRRIADGTRAEDLGPEPGHNWFKRRYHVSYKQSKVFLAGAFVDTMEVATTWDNLYPLYKAVLRAVGREVFIMAHFSHAYREGCSIYFTFAGYGISNRTAMATYRRTWKQGLDAVARHGATISHHHGVGILKRSYLDRETPGGKDVFMAVKRAMDPCGIMNPGKLYAVD